MRRGMAVLDTAALRTGQWGGCTCGDTFTGVPAVWHGVEGAGTCASRGEVRRSRVSMSGRRRWLVGELVGWRGLGAGWRGVGSMSEPGGVSVWGGTRGGTAGLTGGTAACAHAATWLGGATTCTWCSETMRQRVAWCDAH